MPKPAPKHPKTAKPKPQRERVNFYVDASVLESLDNLVSTMPDLDSRSAALRYLVRWHDRTQGEDAAS